MMKMIDEISLLAAMEVVILTTSSAASDNNFIEMMIFPFQCNKMVGIY